MQAGARVLLPESCPLLGTKGRPAPWHVCQLQPLSQGAAVALRPGTSTGKQTWGKRSLWEHILHLGGAPAAAPPAQGLPVGSRLRWGEKPDPVGGYGHRAVVGAWCWPALLCALPWYPLSGVAGAPPSANCGLSWPPPGPRPHTGASQRLLPLSLSLVGTVSSALIPSPGLGGVSSVHALGQPHSQAGSQLCLRAPSSDGASGGPGCPSPLCCLGGLPRGQRPSETHDL